MLTSVWTASARTMVDLFRQGAGERPHRNAFTFLADGEVESGRLSYAELDVRARAVAARLQEIGAAGGRALLLYTSGRDFVVSFFGCLYAGVTAVPAYPPRRHRLRSRLGSIAADCRPAVVLTSAAVAERAGVLSRQSEALGKARWLATDDVADGGAFADALAASWRCPAIGPETLAFLQYTSGSTGSPKGVMVSHANLLHNQEMIRTAFAQGEDSVVVGWLPLYHDMGLIGNVIQPLYSGARCVLMSPMAFLRSPRRWLAAIDRYRGTTSGGPNFAYQLSVDRIGEAERAGLDLSSWTVAFNGAEPVRAATVEGFCAAFAPCGFRREAFYPCYGLAETTLFVTGGDHRAAPTVRAYDAAELERDRAVATVARDGARSLVGCGRAWHGQEVAIVDPASRRRIEDGGVGEVWVAGGSVAEGYWRRPGLSRRVFSARLADDPGAGPFLRSGDLGFVDGGELFVTGRLKDLIIIRGRNLYPQDLELTAEGSHPALVTGGGAAFALDEDGEERLVMVLEVERRAVRGGPAAVESVAEAVRRAVAGEHDVAVRAVALIRPGTLPRTSSGKVRRRACREAYLAGELRMVGESALADGGPGDEPLDWGAEAGGDAVLDRRTLLALDPEERRTVLVGYLRREAARRLGTVPERIDEGRPLTGQGLDSLRALELGGRLAEELGRAPDLAALLEGASVCDLADQILVDVEGDVDEAIPAAGAAVGEHPASCGQRALWFLHRLAPESAAYNVAAAARIRGPLDASALRRAFERLVERHGALRSRFGDACGEVVQEIRPSAAGGFLFRVEEALEPLEARLEDEAHRPFDLAADPLLRVLVLRRGDEEHLLVLTVHHIVADFWSIAVLFHELGEVYGEEAGGAAAALAPLEHTYVDFARWQRALLAGEEGRRLEGFWLAALAGDLEPLDLADRPRPPIQTWDGASVQGWVPAVVSEGIGQVGGERGATLYMTLLAAFQAFLHRYTGQVDLRVGSPTSGRTRPELRGLVGYFVNPVVLRSDLGGDPPFSAVLGRVRRTVLDALRHQAYPFDLLVERLSPGERGSRPPVFQVLFTFQQAPRQGVDAFAVGRAGARLALGGLEWESLPIARRAAQFELALSAAAVGGGLALELTYNRDLFEASTVQRMLGHFRRLLEAVAAAPDTRLSDFDLLTPAERQLFFEGNDTGVELPQTGLLGLVAAQARRTPDAPAVSRAGAVLSYSELWRRAGRLAGHLPAAGPEPIVGLCLERGLDLVVSLFGVLRAGAAYVPLDPAYPDPRLGFLVGDCGAAVVLAHRRHRERLTNLGARVLALEDLEGRPGAPVQGSRTACSSNPEGAKRSARRPQSPGPELPDGLPGPVHPERLAYLIYTSGSTGRPKGVAIRHDGAAALARWAAAAFPSEVWRRVLASTSVNFDLSVFEIFVPLTLGGEVLVASDVLELPRLAGRDRVTLVNTVPSAMAELVRGGGLPSSLEAVVLAGEPLRRTLTDALHGAGVPRVFNYYGPSEDTTYSTGVEVTAGEPGEPTIGRPIAGTAVHLVDRYGRLVPPGVAGELCLAGHGLARGYHRRPALTAERFVPNPSAAAGGRVYRTGDLARRRPGGEIDFLGRRDHQVKVRGFRIELAEVESVLTSLPGVGAAVVMARAPEGRPGDGRLVAWVTLSADATPAALRRELERRLPGYMVPQAIVALDAVPRLPSGKVDRRALPEPERTGGEGAAPATPTEEALAAIWREVLELATVGRDDDFFALGGHSLLATRVVSRLREATGVDVEVRTFFAAPTLRGLAAAVDRAAALSPAVAASPLEALPRRGPTPLSFAQEALWFLDRLHPGETVYNMPAAVRLVGRLDAAALDRALARMAARHESLRTVFADTPEGPRQRLLPAPEAALAHVDLTAVPPEAARTELRSRLERSVRPFDLAAGPLLRSALFHGPEAEEHVLFLDVHHIVSDARSLEVLLRELGAAYGAFRAGAELPLAPSAVQPADHAVWQRRRLESGALDRQLDYWRHRLAGAQPADLPVDRPRPAVPSRRGGRVRRRLPESLVRRLGALAATERATRFQVLLAGYVALLRRYAWQSDLTVGTPMAGRARRQLEDLIGLFVNMVLLRVEAVGQSGFRRLLSVVRNVGLEADANQEMPFSRLVEELGLGTAEGTTPLLRTVFAVESGLAGAFELSGLSATGLAVDRTTAKFELTLTVGEDGDDLAAELEYAADIFDPGTARRLLRHYERLLASAVAEPERPVDELPLLDAAERRRLLGEADGPRRPYPRDASIAALIAGVAARGPHAVALERCGEVWTYGGLIERSRRFARRLAAAGVGLETPVGLCLERSPGQIAAALAILEAGGHYVPLDPGYPRERLRFMIEDSRIAVLVVDDAPPEALLPLPPRVRAVSFAAGGEAPAATLPVVPAAALAYVMYTSGSTGRPKGVAVCHRGVVRLAHDLAELDSGPGEVFLRFAPISFDASTFEIWTPLATGARLALAPAGKLSYVELGRVVSRHRVTTLFLTAGLFHRMVEEQLADLRGVRHLLSGGDVLSPEHVRRVLEDLPGRRMTNAFGPTEGTTWVTLGPLTDAAELAGSVSVPIGRPVHHARVLVLDPRAELVAAGASGHLHLGGDGLARGYAGRPGLTAERFVPDPFVSSPGARLYASGDLARRRADGILEFRGRLDQQVKVRGFRVEPGEIEALLSASREVAEAAVVAREDHPGDRRLVAYLVPARAGEGFDPAACRRLAEGLPEYLRPSDFVVLPRLPLTANGKLDRAALPAPERRAGGLGPAPRSETERRLASIFRRLLGVERVGLDSHFFDSGGHSLLATQLASEIRRGFAVELPLRRVFEAPTLAQLARTVDAARVDEAFLPARPPIEPVDRSTLGGPPPTSFAQERLWFLDRLRPGRPTYTVAAALALDGRLDRGALLGAFMALAGRHEALRTTFAEVGGRPVQVIHDRLDPEIGIVDLADGASEESLRDGLDELARRPFDLAAGPLLRLLLLRRGAERHVLALTLHHIVADGWSTGVLIREAAAFYRAATAGRPARLPALPVQVADHALWQRRHLDDDALAPSLDALCRRLASVPSLELPADRPRPAEPSGRGETLAVELDTVATEALYGAARRAAATPFAAVLAAWGATLSVTAGGQTDFAVGAPVANRNRSETEGLIGCLVNTLVLRLDLAGDPSFDELLARARDTLLEADRHQDVPFERLVKALPGSRDLASTPLFQTLLAFQNTPREEIDLGGLAVSRVPIDTGTAKFDLTLSLAEARDRGVRLEGSLELATDLFDRRTVVELWRRFARLARAAAAEPGRRLSELDLMSAAERAQLATWSRTGDVDDGATLDGLVADRVARAPESTAVSHAGASLSYGALWRRAGRLAGHLSRHLETAACGPEPIVGLCLERGLDLVAALLGTLRAGAAYVPLDPAYPDDRLRLVAEDCGARVALVHRPYREKLAALASGVEVLTPENLVAAAGSPEPRAPSRPDRLAYLIYTSGSTGRPKGVAIRHGSAAALARWAADALPAGVWRGVLASTSVNFDLSVFEVFVPLILGGEVVFAENALELPRLAERDRVTLINTVPSAMAELVRGGGLPPSLRAAVLAGEPLRRSLVDALHRAGVPKVYNGYGPSEDTTYSTAAEVPAGESGEPTIGRPIAGTTAHALDRRGRRVPPGVIGELHLGGCGVARGYLRRPALTAERFVPDPFAAAAGGRLYRTGDLVRWRAGGELTFHGRRDHQVKVRGFRIELGEMEAALSGLPAVTGAAVAARAAAGRPDDLRLVAWVTLAAGGEAASPETLRRELGRRLPGHMVPQAITVLDALPRLPNGKVDRRALPEPAGSVAGGAPPATPATPAEEALAAVWRSVLGIADVGRDDSFFALGGHSLLATRLVSELRHVFGVELPLAEVFNAPRLADLAARLDALGRGPRGPEAAGSCPGPAPVPRPEGGLPLSFAQERLWVLDRLEPGNASYTIPGAVRMRGAVEPRALRRAVARLAARHESLRTTFHAVGGRPVQVIAPPAAVDAGAYLADADLRRVPPEARPAEVSRCLAADLARPFDLSRGPLLRLALLRFADDEAVLVLAVHHIVADGWSMALVTRELGLLYHAERTGGEARLPELPVQYADVAVWQRRFLAGAELDRQLAAWRRRLAGMPQALELPVDRLRPAVRRYRGGRVVGHLGPALGEAVEELARRLGATPFMVLLAAFELLLGRLAGEEDFGVGIPIAGRRWREAEGLVGMFLNTLVLRADLSGGPSFAALVGRVRETALDAYAHQDLPFERLLEELTPERDLSRSPLFQVFFNMLNLPPAELHLPGLDVEPVATPVAPSKFDLTVYVHRRGAGFELEWIYDADLFDAERMEIAAAQYEHLLGQAVTSPERPIEDFDLRPALARAPVLLPDPAAPLDPSWLGSTHGMFDARAEREGDRLAVADPDVRLSYRQLSELAHKLARALARAGVGRGDAVAIWAYRGAELVPAVLAVLGSGGAFVLLDPTYPGARLAAVARLARPRALLRLTAAGEPPPELSAALDELGAARFDVRPAAGGLAASLAAFPAVDPGVVVGADDVAYLAFTSGSTGEPKGIAGRHGPLSHFHPYMTERFGFAPGQRFAMLSGLAHDPLHRDLFTPLAGGGSIHIPDPRKLLAAGYLARWLAREGVEATVLTPAMGQVLAAGADETGATVPSLRWIFLVGDVLSRRDVERLARLAPNATCVNLYGSTETQRAVAFYESPRGATGDGKEILPLGRGMRDVQLLVLAAGDRLAGVGELGEICVRSPHLAAGYLGAPEETARRFVVNPFTGDPSDRLYRTGDLGRYRPSGDVVFAGRADQQVKVRGFRIELGEVEAHLGRLDGVAEAVVLAAEERSGERRLVAYLAARSTGAGAVTEARLRQRLRERLPAYMVPAAFVVMDKLPLTPNGKVDRRTLVRMRPASREKDMAYRAPRSELEKTLAGILQQVLAVERVGMDDNFFDLGGTSLALVEVHHRIREATGIEVMPVELFNHPTVASLASHLHGVSTGEGPAPAVRTRERDRSEQLDRGRNRLMEMKSWRRSAR